jgi:hypothetical protein
MRHEFREYQSTIYGGFNVGDDLSVTNSFYAGGNLVLTDYTAYNKTKINAQRAGILTPSKIEITSDAWSQIKINSTSDSVAVPSEIAINRQIKHALLGAAMGVSGDTERGAWAGLIE